MRKQAQRDSSPALSRMQRLVIDECQSPTVLSLTWTSFMTKCHWHKQRTGSTWINLTLSFWINIFWVNDSPLFFTSVSLRTLCLILSLDTYQVAKEIEMNTSLWQCTAKKWGLEFASGLLAFPKWEKSINRKVPTLPEHEDVCRLPLHVHKGKKKTRIQAQE